MTNFLFGSLASVRVIALKGNYVLLNK
jgi:hypothetical protein